MTTAAATGTSTATTAPNVWFGWRNKVVVGTTTVTTAAIGCRRVGIWWADGLDPRVLQCCCSTFIGL